MPSRKQALPNRKESRRREADAAARILAERTAHLAARQMATVERPGRRVLACSAGDAIFALDIADVSEVLPFRDITPLAHAHPALLGLFGRSGRLFSALDLHMALGLAGAPPEGGHLLLLRRSSPCVALRVARVLGAVEASSVGSAGGEDAPAAVQSFIEAPAGTLADEASVLGLLSLDQLLAPFTASSSSLQPGV
jgi:purine-binding chemotaxis protein CheW